MIQKTIITICLLLGAFILSSCDDEDSPSGIINHVKEGDPLPSFEAYGAAHQLLTTEMLTGKRVVLVLFSTECPDCQRELPKIEAVWKHFKEEADFTVVTIARGESAEMVSAYWEKEAGEKKPFTMPFYLDPDRAIFNAFANSYVPRVYLVNREGVITWMGIETIEPTAEELIEMVNSL